VALLPISIFISFSSQEVVAPELSASLTVKPNIPLILQITVVFIGVRVLVASNVPPYNKFVPVPKRRGAVPEIHLTFAEIVTSFPAKSGREM
jgi:hypothetical protein